MSTLLINEPPLMVLPSLAQSIGLNEAIILQQVHYWLNPQFNKNFKEGHYWVHNSYEQWQDQFRFWSTVTIKRTIQSLEKKGLLLSSNFNASSFNKTKWYRINYEKLSIASERPHRWDQNDPSIRSNRPKDRINLTPSYIDTENTSENTSTPTPKKGERREETISLLEKMIKTWHEIVQEKKGSLPSVSLREKALEKAISYFDGDFLQWEQYCKKIASSKFLMGETKEKFSIKLDWALKIEIIERILEGAYSGGDREPKSSEEDKWEQARKAYERLTEEEIDAFQARFQEKYPGEQPSSASFKHFVVKTILLKLN